MLSRLFERFDPDLYRVREGENTLGDAETIEDDDSLSDEACFPVQRPCFVIRRSRKDDKRGGSHPWAGQDGKGSRGTKQRISVGSPAPAQNLLIRIPSAAWTGEGD
jgi:hypothetical protein